MDTAASARKKLSKVIGLGEGAALLVGLLYVTGYSINSIFVRNYGIPESELFRLEYIKIGFVFWLITGGIFFIPFGAFFLTHKVRTSSGLPHFYLGWVGNSSNTIVMLGVPLLLSFFATRFEWYLPLAHPVLTFHQLNIAVGWGLAAASFGAICMPIVERLMLKYTANTTRTWLFRLLVEPLRFGCLVLAVYLISFSVIQIPWISLVFGRAGSYIAVSILFVSGITAAIYWVRHIEKIQGSSIVFLLIGFGVSFFYYLSIASYVFGVYPAIPANRGGAMPVTEAYIETSGHNSLFQGQHDMTGFSIRGPIYIMEQTSDTLYFTAEDTSHWFERFVPTHALSKSAIAYIRLERIEDGFPRVPRKHQGQLNNP